MNHFVFLRAFFLVVGLAAAVLAFAATNEPVACTMEAKICPDGATFVGREGPNCEFAVCPPSSCPPYMCADGTQISRCTADGTVINYFAAPCLTHGGEVTADSFTDVSSSHPNADAIAYVKAEGIVEGYSDGTYRPDRQINRAEFVKILIGSEFGNIQVRGTGPDPFPDVPADAWYTVYVNFAYSPGYISGYPDGTFRPAANINFVEAAKIISKVLNLKGDGTSVWYEGYVRGLADNGAIPLSITSFDQPITRGEMAEMIWRLKAGVADRTSQTYDTLANATAPSSGVEYLVRYNLDTGTDVPLEDQYDGPIIARDLKTGKETVVVKSVKDAIPALRERWNLTIGVFVQPTGAKPVFKTILKETDNSGGDFYQFDPATRTFTPMQLSSVYSGFYDGSVVAPDERYVAWAREANEDKYAAGLVQSLYLASFANDSYAALVVLSGNETLNGGPSDAMGVWYDITWVDSQTVRYAVFDQKKKEAGLYMEDALIGYRTVSID